MASHGNNRKRFEGAFEAAFKPAPDETRGQGAGDLLGARAKARDMSAAAPELGRVYVVKTIYGFEVTRTPDAADKQHACFDKGSPVNP